MPGTPSRRGPGGQAGHVLVCTAQIFGPYVGRCPEVELASRLIPDDDSLRELVAHSAVGILSPPFGIPRPRVGQNPGGNYESAFDGALYLPTGRWDNLKRVFEPNLKWPLDDWPYLSILPPRLEEEPGHGRRDLKVHQDFVFPAKLRGRNISIVLNLYSLEAHVENFRGVTFGGRQRRVAGPRPCTG